MLNNQLDNFMKKVYEEVHVCLNSSFPHTSLKNLSETLDAKCKAIDKLSDVLKHLKFASLQDFDRNEDRTLQIKPVMERATFKFGSVLQNIFTTSSIQKAVQVLGANPHLKHLKQLAISQNDAHKVNLNLTVVSQNQEKIARCSSLFSHINCGQDTEILDKIGQNHVDIGSSHEEILLPAACTITKTNAHKLLLPPIPAIPNSIRYSRPYSGVPITKWGHEDDIQVQHQKQTSTQLLHFLKVKAQTTGVLNATVMEWHNSFDLPQPQTVPLVKHITKETCNFPQDTAWSSGTLSKTENQAPLFKIKRLNSNGVLTYTCMIATKTELWDIGDIVTDFESERNSVSSEDTRQIVPSKNTPKWIDVSVQKGDGTCAKTHVATSVTIPEFQNKRFEEIEVMVSHIVNPGNFYIQHIDANEKLLTLFSDSNKRKSTSDEHACIPDIGTKVMGWFSQQKQWCRSQVTKICGISKDDVDSTKEMSIYLEVKRLDYGDLSRLSLTNIKELTSEMAVLPLQAVQVSLAHVSPVNGRNWSDEAVGWFRDMVHNRTLYARLYPEGNRILVDLFLEKGKIEAMRRGASLSLRLTQNGHAKHANLKNSVGTVQLKMKKKDLEWEKYLISCYTQSNLHRAALQ